ncbi:hypothetical protein [Priestia taiwanensis]|uniref:Uncharacterized protein n=1 Tax=Priestia taiwanensis TaxID=1347902 RepID=A0A917AS99_9BACI|nr:hypothetical protein [Priestia taiwanensis]MBM7364095.1 hypothetical protein [Priestia taiwanensis]GGE71567.1 hypothetical protein GCM10007140_21880 [Priestia taiwanensis]
MNTYPSELDFISLFECLPTKKDKDELYEYDETTFTFEVGNHACDIMICPFYSQFSLEVKTINENELVCFYHFQSVDRIEILSDKKEHSATRLFMEGDRDRFMTIMEITFKPRFKVIMKEIFG